MPKRVDTIFTRWWRHASLVQRLVIITLVPCVLTAILLVTLLTRHQMESLRTMAREAAQAIAAETAAVSTEPLRRGDRKEVRRIASSISQLSHVIRVQIDTPRGAVLTTNRLLDRTRAEPTLRVHQDILARDDPTKVIGTVVVDVSLNRALEVQRSGIDNALRWLAVSIVLALLVAWQEARWISAPLRKLAAAIQQLGEGRQQVRLAVTDDTEIGRLQAGFNAAAEALHQYQREMEKEVEQATRELAEKNAALEAASIDKSRFLAAATHDLRQPLYALTLFSSSLSIDETDPVRLERIAHVQECIASLDNLFSELLDLSRLESGAMRAEPADFALDTVFEEVNRNFRLLAEQHDLRLIIRPTPLWVHSDRTMLARILNNLVSNALRYTQDGGVLLAARRRGDGVRIDVWDTGPGIREEDQQRVFDEFYRVNSGSHENSDGPRTGLGLGLATVQRLAKLIGTTVTLSSRPGHGSLFSLTVAGATPWRLARPARPALPHAPSVSGLRVLVIDDDPAILAGIRVLLESWGCDVKTAEDKEQAIAVVSEWDDPPEIVISDLALRRGRNGLAAMDALAEHYVRDGYTEAPFIRMLITGETDRERLSDALEAGIPILFKPVSPEQLREAMASLLALRRNDSGGA